MGCAERDADIARRARRVPSRCRPLHRRARRGVLPPLRGPERPARPRGDLRAPCGADRARDGAGHRRVGERRPADARALALRLRRLHREADARACGEGSSARGGARGDRRRRDDPLPDAASHDGERARPRAPREARPRAVGGDRGAPEPGLLREHRGRARRSAAARRLHLRRALRALRPRAAQPRPPVRVLPRLDGAAVRGHARPRHPRAARPLTGRAAALGSPPDDPLAPVGRGLPGRQDGAGAQGNSLRSRDRPRQPGQRPPRHRAASRRSRRAPSARRSRCPTR